MYKTAMIKWLTDLNKQLSRVQSQRLKSRGTGWYYKQVSSCKPLGMSIFSSFSVTVGLAVMWPEPRLVLQGSSQQQLAFPQSSRLRTCDSCINHDWSSHHNFGVCTWVCIHKLTHTYTHPRHSQKDCKKKILIYIYKIIWKHLSRKCPR